MSKILITSGCSFSECISYLAETWPKHLARLLPEYEHNSYAMGSQGNGLISRGIIYGVSQALRTYKPEDIFILAPTIKSSLKFNSFAHNITASFLPSAVEPSQVNFV